jgi:hypothetical protein
MAISLRRIGKRGFPKQLGNSLTNFKVLDSLLYSSPVAPSGLHAGPSSYTYLSAEIDGAALSARPAGLIELSA